MSSKLVASAKVSPRKNEHGEWVVRAYDADGKRIPDADYFTTDKDDAEGTALAMVKPETTETAPADDFGLTDLERTVLVKIVNNEFSEGDPERETWTFVVCDNPSWKGAFGSLVRKGLAWSQEYDRDSDMCGLTESGKAVYARLTANA